MPLSDLITAERAVKAAKIASNEASSKDEHISNPTYSSPNQQRDPSTPLNKKMALNQASSKNSSIKRKASTGTAGSHESAKKSKKSAAIGSGTSGPAKAAQSTQPARPRTPTDVRHNTEVYPRYDPWTHRNIAIPNFRPRNFTFDSFNGCPLYMELTNSADMEEAGKWNPPKGVRLDDYNCGEALLRLNTDTMAEIYPAEFDSKGMLRATRNPLGHARKIFVTPGMTDGDGNVAGDNDRGYYYAWFRGLQPLMGKEGFGAKLYKIRPSGEKFKAKRLTWFLHSRCVIQLPTGHPADPTFKPGAIDMMHGFLDKVSRTISFEVAQKLLLSDAVAADSTKSSTAKSTQGSSAEGKKTEAEAASEDVGGKPKRSAPRVKIAAPIKAEDGELEYLLEIFKDVKGKGKAADAGSSSVNTAKADEGGADAGGGSAEDGGGGPANVETVDVGEGPVNDDEGGGSVDIDEGGRFC